MRICALTMSMPVTCLGDGVLDLDARIDLDEVEVAGVGIHQELDRAGADIVRGAGDREA